MKTFFRLLALFMAMPVVELALLLKVSDWMGYLPTVALIIATAVAGSYLAKREGLSAWNRLQGSLSQGGLPGDELIDAVIVLVAGAFLITPGVLTDVIGFCGLIPLTRGWLRRFAKRRLKKAVREGRLQATFGSLGGAGMGGSAGPDGFETDAFDPAGTEQQAETDGPAVAGEPSPRGPSATAGDGSAAGDASSPAASPSGPSPRRKLGRPLDADDDEENPQKE